MRKAITTQKSAQRQGASDSASGHPNSSLALLTIWIAVTMAVLDSVIVNVALPTISERFHVTASTAIWVINAYQLAITVALLPCAALGDRLGYRRVYLAGLTLFTIASVGCTLSQTISHLIIARTVQGLGAGAIMSLNGALLRFSVPESSIGRMLGRNAIVISVATALGPTLAGVIINFAGWPWLFAINAPLGLLAIALGKVTLPGYRGSGGRMDWIAALLNAVTFGGIIFGGEQLGSGHIAVGATCLGLGILAAITLVRHERHEAAPLIPVDLLRIRLFALSIVTSMMAFTAHMLAFVCLPFYFQQVLNKTAIETAGLMTPWPVCVGFAAALSGRLADRVSPGMLGGVGLFVFSAGLVGLSLIGTGSSTLEILAPMALSGAGFGFFQSPNNRVMILAAPKNRSGAAGGALAMARLLGQTLGALVAAMVFLFAGVGASQAALAGAAALAAVAALVSFSRAVGPKVNIS